MPLINAIRHPISVARQLAEARRQREFYRAFVKPGELVFDVGANLGDRTAVFRSLGAKVVAVEPQQSCVQALRARFDDGVVIVAEGVADAPGIKKMALGDAHVVSTMEPEWVSSMTASQRFGSMEWAETVDVEVTTLDRLIEQHGLPAFAKIDVEGFESSVLRGLSRRLPAVSVEFVQERPEATEACVRRLDELGMTEFNYAVGETMALASEEWIDSQTVLERVSGLGGVGAWGDIYARSAPAARSGDLSEPAPSAG